VNRPLLAILLLLDCSCASAHISSNGFVTLSASGSQVRGSLELAIRDAELAVGLDSNGDGAVTWGEVRAHQPQLTAYVRDRFTLSAHGSPCAISFEALQVNSRVDGNYLWLPFSALCSAARPGTASSSQPLSELGIDYRLLQDIDPSHRGLVTLSAWGETQTGVLTPGRGAQAFALGHPQPLRAFAEYLSIGVWHIWSGIDHLLFLLSLLLPAVLRRHAGQWEAAPIARPAFVNILKVVTAFTLAHSITLSLAAFNVVHLPSRLTESIIAASIIVAALNNIFPRVTEGRWRIAFAFGLLHGFGFASVLAEMGLPSGARLVSLVAFNLGVEIGQLAVVLAVMPLAYYLRATSFYRHTVMRWGSSAIAALAFVWLVQRATA
jgi:hypothetical protein